MHYTYRLVLYGNGDQNYFYFCGLLIGGVKWETLLPVPELMKSLSKYSGEYLQAAWRYFSRHEYDSAIKDNSLHYWEIGEEVDNCYDVYDSIEEKDWKETNWENNFELKPKLYNTKTPDSKSTKHRTILFYEGDTPIDCWKVLKMIQYRNPHIDANMICCANDKRRDYFEKYNLNSRDSMITKGVPNSREIAHTLNGSCGDV